MCAGSVPQISDVPSVYEVTRPYEIARKLQTRHLLPSPPAADIRTQEGDIIWTHLTTYQGDYNTQRYLQENFPVAVHARNEPLRVMSSVNQKLENVQVTCRMPRVPANQSTSDNPCCDVLATSTGVRRTLAAGLSAINCPRSSPSTPEPESTHCPPCDRYEIQQSSNQYDLSGRRVARLVDPWPRCRAAEAKPPGTGLGCVSTRAEALVRFNEAYGRNCGPAPDLRKNTTKGKKHTFLGNINSQVLRGSTLAVS
jgi:hypothetical protein